LTLLLAAQGSSAAAQTPAKPAHTLRVTTDGAPFISLDADGARLSAIAADLSERLGVRVTLGPTLLNETISASFVEASLESALIALAPRAYIDHEIRRGVPPVRKEIYLGGLVEPEPPVRGSAQGLLITGHTEETPKPSATDPLRVMLEFDRLTVISREQPLAVVVLAVADMLNVPAEIEFESGEIVDADVRDTPENALLALSPNIRVDVRTDVWRGTRSVRRVAVARGGVR
jgi:hypothetical protein